MQTNKKSSHVYDYAIIGSGLSGLLAANALNKVTSNIILIEQNESFGGTNKSIQTPVGMVNNGLRFFPETNNAQQAIAYLEMLLMNHLNPTVEDNQVYTFENGGLKSFVGFGESHPNFYEEFSYFLSTKKIKLNLEPHEWVQMLFNNFTGDFLPRSQVTKFVKTEEKISQCIINGQKNIVALNFIYCGPTKYLKALMPTDFNFGRKTKNTFGAAVGIDFLHGDQISEHLNLHLLNGTTDDEMGPCVGHFFSATTLSDEPVQYSQWVTFLNQEDIEDTEIIGASLKKIKKQIKRAYPIAFDKLKFERIIVNEAFTGSDLKINANLNLTGLDNLWIGSPQAHQQRNILGCLLQSQLLTAALGCNPLGLDLQIKEEVPEATNS